MTDDERFGENSETAAEHRLVEHLAMVRANPPETEQTLTHRVVRRARWQRLVRAPLEVIGVLIGALADAVSAFAGSHNRDPETRR